jgi:hypothetical protein
MSNKYGSHCWEYCGDDCESCTGPIKNCDYCGKELKDQSRDYCPGKCTEIMKKMYNTENAVFERSTR